MTTDTLSAAPNRTLWNNVKVSWEQLPWWGRCVALWLLMLVVLNGIGLVSANVVSMGIGFPTAPSMIDLQRFPSIMRPIAPDSPPGAEDR